MTYIVKWKFDEQDKDVEWLCGSLKEMLDYRDTVIKSGNTILDVKENLAGIELCEEQCQGCKQKQQGQLCRQFRELIGR